MPHQRNNLKPYQILSPIPHPDRRDTPPLSGANPAAGHLTGEPSLVSVWTYSNLQSDLQPQPSSDSVCMSACSF